ncbi:MAG: hypothetical protein HY860_02020 [Chlamydiales bacterium]|nr:hypothetical protein [Chlamydiales bacterium]
MYQTLLEQAKKDKIEYILVGAVVNKNGRVLLMEHSIQSGPVGLFEIPSIEIKSNETILDALRRLFNLRLGLELGSIDRYLNHQDFMLSGKKTRQLNFIVTALDSYEINTTYYQGYAFVKPNDGVGYPINEKNMEILDLFTKTLD